MEPQGGDEVGRGWSRRALWKTTFLTNRVFPLPSWWRRRERGDRISHIQGDQVGIPDLDDRARSLTAGTSNLLRLGLNRRSIS